MEPETEFRGNIMKRFLIATALTLAAASSAMAGTYDGTKLPQTLQYDIRTYVPNADLSNLSLSQVAQLYSLFSSSKNLRSGESPDSAIKAILSDHS
jgi:hypothetical protein